MPRVQKPKRFEFNVNEIVIQKDDNLRILLNTLSSLFPEGEAFFVRAVRAYRNKLPVGSDLNSDVSRFIGQEAFHSIAHDSLNRELYKKGYWDPTATVRFFLVNGSNYLPRLSLHVTAILEHWTATLARQVLKDEYDLTIAEKALWFQHAREEIDHSHVSWELLCETGNFLTPLWSKLLFPVISGIFIVTVASMYYVNGGRVDLELFRKLSKNILPLCQYMLPGYVP